MTTLDVSVFELDRGREALEKYGAVMHLTVQVYGADGCLIAGPAHRTPLFDLLAGRLAPGIFSKCARACLDRSHAGSPVVIEEWHGLTVVGTALRLAGEIVGAAVAGYGLTMHPGPREITRLARDCRLAFDDVWAVMRKELPVPRSRLPLHGELLGILGDTLLTEHYRSRQLEETSMRLAQASEAKDKFLAVLSHELRTPLATILGYARILRTGKLDEGAADQALEAIDRNAKLQTRLIEDLLDMSRIISGTLRLRAEPIAVAPLLEAAVANVRPGAQTKGISLDLVLDPSAEMISGDPVRMQQIVSNLLVNAIKFTPAGGRVEVRLERNGPEVQIVVKDTGPGIRRDFLPYVFDRFRQDDTTEARSHGGLGLGLAIVRHLVELHDGSVCAESPGAGQGATFTISLPALAGAEARFREAVPPTSGSSEAMDDPPMLKGLRVLVVDDDADARVLFTRALEQCEAQVTAVPSAGAALAALEGRKADVLVSDIGMPKESGYVLIRKIRRLTREQGGEIPALALTAYASPDDAKLALAAGFQAYLAKPVEPVELARAVADLARGLSTA
ncbi:MAG TPA: hybrid sensor histidine kinase/response regulator [Methylomirabilota bacterium]|nr:hybrid sensor histidine kinase/response regulator [Methylomirabilota bacterium]